MQSLSQPRLPAHSRPPAAGGGGGFTMIELLVVIGIISLLMGALMTGLSSGGNRATKDIEKIRLIKHWINLKMARDSGAALPPEGGAQFVYYPWVSGAVDRSPETLETHFLADSISPRLAELRQHDPRTVHRSYDSIGSEDTDYAGRRAETYTRRMFRDWKEPLLATDNEHGNAFADGSVLVLYGNGKVRELKRDDVLGAGCDPDAVIEVGPDSQAPVLRKLAR